MLWQSSSQMQMCEAMSNTYYLIIYIFIYIYYLIIFAQPFGANQQDIRTALNKLRAYWERPEQPGQDDDPFAWWRTMTSSPNAFGLHALVPLAQMYLSFSA